MKIKLIKNSSKYMKENQGYRKNIFLALKLLKRKYVIKKWKKFLNKTIFALDDIEFLRWWKNEIQF